MHKLASAIALAVGTLAFFAAPDAAARGASSTNRYVVVFKTSTLPADAALLVAANGGKTTHKFEKVGVMTVQGDAAFASRMAKDGKVLSVGTEHVFKLPQTVKREAAAPEGAPTAADGLYAAYQWDMRRMGAPALWNRLPLTTAAPRVAVLDTGVMGTHPDLVGQLDASVSTTYCNTVGPDGSPAYPSYATLIDFDAHPDWSPEDGCTPAAVTYETHGTHVAGTIAAKFGGGLVVGVSPDAKIGAYKVFDRYRYTDPVDGLVDAVGAFDGPLFSAIIQATEAGYPVISMSLGSHVLRNDQGSNASWLAWDRIAKWANRNGALLVASAGNSAYNLNGSLAHVPSDLSSVLSTSAMGTSQLIVVNGQYVAAPGTDTLASYSNYGSSVDVSAPGGDCGPPVCDGRYFIANAGIGPTGAAGYYLMAGTSMATPHVSAVAAQVRALHPDWTPGEVRSWLKETAQRVGSRQGFGAGMVDADAATR